MNNKVELPTCIPFYTTYNYQIIGGVVAAENPDIRNWYLNTCMNLVCNRRFLRGYTSPEIDVEQTHWSYIPHIEKFAFNMRFIREQIHSVIKNMLNEGYYVAFEGVDDFYIEGKSWYQEEHRAHDGLICGYDETDQTYTIMAYDKRWICSVFKTPQKCFEEGVFSMLEQGCFGTLTAMKAQPVTIDLDVSFIKTKLKEYLNSNMDIYPPEIEDTVYGIVVHDYIGMYLDQLFDGTTPYEKKDRRIFRLLWEHKKCMLKRLHAMEEALDIENMFSKEYENIVEESNLMRLMYAKFTLKRQSDVLPLIKEKLMRMKEKEQGILEQFILKLESEGK